MSLVYPRGWFVTSKPLSNGKEPVYRVAVSNFRARRTPLDTGPCLAGIAKQRSQAGVFAVFREARGADKILSRFPRRPRTFALPRPADEAGCLGTGSKQVSFKENGRAFYLWISVGPRASAQARASLRSALQSLRIDRRSA